MRQKLIVVYRNGNDDSTGFLPGVFHSRDEAAATAGAYLWEKREVHITLANQLDIGLREADIGTVVTFGHTRTDFRILNADFTSDGVPIVPGMRVLDYDRELGTVVARQFMSDSLCAPGGECFEGWYDVEKDSGTVRPFNGDRLRRP